ncbi:MULTISPECIES: hypothetical protein [Aquimarina]|uniref:hypothetical protein n=1 Tax=Aquimarina TaxID=290174 RepID=UPI0009442FDF|nr:MULTISPECIES: hypothetical protein [Aquimarina]
MKKQIQQLVDYANNKQIKKFKRVILFVFIALVVLDVIFVSIPEYPSISRVIYGSSPKFIVLIWFFGLFISNIFFQRNVIDNKYQSKYFVLLATCSILFLILGFYLKSITNINCENYKEKEIKYVTRVLCQKHYKCSAQYDNLNCELLDCNDDVGNIKFKIDITNTMKLLILVFGIVAGYLFWPKKIEL